MPSDTVRKVLNEVKDNLRSYTDVTELVPEVEQNWEWEKLSLLSKEIAAALKKLELIPIY